MSDQLSKTVDSRARRSLILFVLALASTLPTINLTVANAVLPQMQGDLSASLEEVSWVLTAALVSTAIGVPTSSWFSMRFGRRRSLLAALSAFTFASAMFGVATTLEEVILWRACQGLFGGAIPALCMAGILDAYPKRSHAMAPRPCTATARCDSLLRIAFSRWRSQAVLLERCGRAGRGGAVAQQSRPDRGNVNPGTGRNSSHSSTPATTDNVRRGRSTRDPTTHERRSGGAGGAHDSSPPPRAMQGEGMRLSSYTAQLCRLTCVCQPCAVTPASVRRGVTLAGAQHPPP